MFLFRSRCRSNFEHLDTTFRLLWPSSTRGTRFLSWRFVWKGANIANPWLTGCRVQVDDGLMKAWLGQSSSMIEAPELHSGTWTRVDVEFREEEVQTTVDGIYSVVMFWSLIRKR